MTLIAFVRHGSTYWNKERRMQGHAQNPLDEEGFAQARLLAERLGGERWDVLYASDLLRARQTAECVLERLPLAQIRYDERLREMDRGQALGTTEEERIARWGADWREVAPGVESDAQGTERGGSFVREVAALHPGQRILAISHGMIIRNTLNGLLPDFHAEPALNNTSVTIVRWTGSRWACELYNCTKHLPGQESEGCR